MDENFLCYLSSIGSKVYIKQNDLLIQEGDRSDCFFVIVRGSAQVSRKAGDISLEDKQYFTGSFDQSFKVFEKGRLVGEAGFFQDGNRTQTVMALEDSELIKVNYQDVEKLQKTDPEKHNFIVLALGEHITIRLRSSSEILVHDLLAGLVESKKRQYFSNLLLTLSLMGAFLLLTIDLWRYAYGALPPIGDTLLSCIVIFAIFMCFYINKKKAPLSFFGINLNNFKKSVYDGLIYSVFISFFGTAFKYFYISDKSQFVNGPIFEKSITNSLVGTVSYFVFYKS